MTQRIAYLEAVVGADITNFRREMRNVRGELGGVTGAFADIQRLGRQLTFAFTAPMIGLGATIVSATMDFEAAMRNINSIAGLTEEQFAGLSARTLEWGSSIRTGPLGAAEALYTVFSAGIMNVEDAFAIAQISAYTAEAGLSDLTITTNALVASLLSYGDTSEEMANRASNALTRMVQVGVGSMESFAGAIATVLPAASAAGVSIEELYGDVAFLTQRGFSAARATTALNAAISSMMKPTEAMSAAFQQLGVNGVEQLIDQFGGLNDGIMALVGTTDGSLESISAMFNNIRGARAIFAMTSNVEDLDQAMADFMAGLDTATLDAWEQQMMSTEAQVDLMKSALSGLAITIGQHLLPMITPIITGIADFANNLSHTNPVLMELVVGMAAIATALPPLIWLFGGLANPIVLFTTALVGLVGFIASNADAFRAGLESIIGPLEGFNTIISSFLDVFGTTQAITDIDAYWSAVNDELQAGVDATVATAGQQFTLGEDMFIWDVWQNSDVQDMFGGDYDAFLTNALDQLGITDPRHVQAGMVLEFGAVEGDDWTTDLLSDFWTTESDDFLVDIPFLDRLINAFNTVRPQLETAVSGAWDSATTWVTDVGLPALDNVGGDILDTIAGWFDGSSNTDGKTETFGFFDSVLNAVREFSFAETFPAINTALGNLIGNMGDWLVNEGVPTFARALGTFSGTVAVMIGEAIGSIFSGVRDQSEGTVEAPILLSAVGSWVDMGAIEPEGINFTEMIVQPFLEGVSGAFAEAEFDSIADLFFTGLATVLVATTAMNFFMGQLLSLGFVRLITGTITRVFAMSGMSALFGKAGSMVAGGLGSATTTAVGGSAGTTALAGIGTAIASTLVAVLGGVGLGVLIYDQMVQSGVADDIREGVFGFLSDVTNTDITFEGFNRWVEDAVYDALGMDDYVSTDGTTMGMNVEIQPVLLPASPGSISASVGGGMQNGFQQEAENAYGMFGNVVNEVFGTPLAPAIQVSPQVAIPDNALSNEGPTNFVSSLTVSLIPDFAPMEQGVTTWEGTNFITAAVNADLIPATEQITSWVTPPVAVPLQSNPLEIVNQLNAQSYMVDVQANVSVSLEAVSAAMEGLLDFNLPGFASGGSIGANQLSIVGEEGPELFLPSSSGTIIPNDMLSGGGGDTYIQETNNISISGVQNVDALLYELRRRGIVLQ